MNKRVRHILCVIIAVQSGMAAPIFAQEPRPSRSLFERLFGGPEPVQPAPRQRVQPGAAPVQQPRQRQPVSRPVVPVPVTPPPRALNLLPNGAGEVQGSIAAEGAVEIVKNADATKIAVFGANWAKDAALGMQRHYGLDPTVEILNFSDAQVGVLASGRDSFESRITLALREDDFSIALMMGSLEDALLIGENGAVRSDYEGKLRRAVERLSEQGKVLVWIEMPAVEDVGKLETVLQANASQRTALASLSVQWVDIYDRFIDENDQYVQIGPDLNGNMVVLRDDDGVGFTKAGEDKLSFYIDRVIKPYIPQVMVGSIERIEVTDALAGTDAARMLRPPFQGVEQTYMVDMASLAQPLGGEGRRASSLITSDVPIASARGFDLREMLFPPAGRADAF